MSSRVFTLLFLQRPSSPEAIAECSLDIEMLVRQFYGLRDISCTEYGSRVMSTVHGRHTGIHCLIRHVYIMHVNHKLGLNDLPIL